MRAISTEPLLMDASDWLLEIPEDLRQQVWNRSRDQGSPAGCWRSYVNGLAATLLQDLIRLDYGQPAVAWLGQSQQREIFEVVTGSAIALGAHRLIVIPTEALDDDCSVPQEWVDIPSWKGDYYAFVQLSPCESYVRILGYATHRQLKTQGEYDAFDRGYNLSINQLISWDSFEPTYANYSADQTQVAVEPLPELSPAQAESLLQRLGNPAQVMPRLEVPFAQWGALIALPQWRQQLWCDRCGLQPTPSRQAVAAVTKLSSWLQGEIHAAWQGVELLLGPTQFARSNRSPGPDSPDFSRGHSPASEPRSIDGLEVRAATDSSVGEKISRAKRLELAPEVEVALSVTMVPLESGDHQVMLYLDPLPDFPRLPDDIELHLLSETGEILGQAKAASSETIRMQFRAAAGERFDVSVLCGEASVRESFEI